MYIQIIITLVYLLRSSTHDTFRLSVALVYDLSFLSSVGEFCNGYTRIRILIVDQRHLLPGQLLG